MKLLFDIALLASIVLCQAIFMEKLQLKTCTMNADCSTEQCCAILSATPVWSRRRDLQTTPLTGSCMNYIQEGEHCDPFAKDNGYGCGCAAGQQCSPHKIGVNKRGPLPPGWESLCTKV